MPGLCLQSTLPLSDNGAVPRLGLGVYQIEDPADCEQAVRVALDCGYRHIDTAAIYRNEEAVGRAVADDGLGREEIFVTTKCWITDFGKEETRTACESSLRRLGMDYVDLYLLHWPVDATMMDAWETLIALRDEGKCRSIGVSNFTTRRFEEFFVHRTDVMPSVNQIEVHPFSSRTDTRAYCRQHGIVVESYSPLARATHLNHPVLRHVAEEAGTSVAQVMLRWHLQHGLVAIPKSRRPERIQENAAVFSMTLSPHQMQRIDALNQDASVASWLPEGGLNWY